MKRVSIVIAASVLLAACDKPANVTTSEAVKPVQQVVVPEKPMPKREHKLEQVVRGAAGLKQNSAE
mgnify:CR=1 FL=1